ncbi:MAG: PIN domain-containing protein [Sphingobacteriaceae bacterium]|nr:PIN domain-containing protein [Cytophagaceae bacterium]
MIRKGASPPPDSYLSIVVVGELKAFALKRHWGLIKRQQLDQLLTTLPILDLDTRITDVYATVDAYSQGLLFEDPLPPGISARNMGKNDLWIAATAFHFDLELQTTDNDFDHLLAIGLKLNKIGFPR